MPGYVVAGNWKMNKTIPEGRALAAELKSELTGIDNVTPVVCPPFISLSAVAEELEGSDIAMGAQNAHYEESGAFTGEVSLSMLAGVCEYVIVGHSERRQLFGESDGSVNRKTIAAQASGLRPIVCVGESLEQRENGQAESIVASQVRAALATVESIEGVLIAYEPIWAIGTGVAATPADAQHVMSGIRAALSELFGASAAGEVPLLYGGSASPGNAAGFFAEADVNGALVGGASLQADSFAAISRAASEARES